MKTLIITLSLLTFSLTSNSQSKTAPFGKYYHLNGYGLQVPFEALPIKTDPIENAVMTSQEFRSFPTTTINSAYAISILNSKQFSNLSDSSKELEFFAKLIKPTAENIMKGKMVYEKEEVYKNKPCYMHKFSYTDQELKEDFYMTSIMFFHKSNVIKVYVITPKQNDNNARIQEYFDNIVLQDEVINTDNNDEEIYTVVPTMPQLGDTKEALQEYIQKNSKFPTSLKKTETSKNVFVKVVIEKDGKVKFDKVMRGVNEKLDSEAKRVVENMPNWSPGLLANGKTVRTYMSFPFWFE
jgi:hypothetical protein